MLGRLVPKVQKWLSHCRQQKAKIKCLKLAKRFKEAMSEDNENFFYEFTLFFGLLGFLKFVGIYL